MVRLGVLPVNFTRWTSSRIKHRHWRCTGILLRISCFVLQAARSLGCSIRGLQSVGTLVRFTKVTAVTMLVALLFVHNLYAQDSGKEDRGVIELGAAVSRSMNDAVWSLGPTVAVEVTPIENWLELEAGLTPSFSAGSTEWSTDLLFKKPWTLSHRVEFMVGIGPEWVHLHDHNVITNSVSAEGVLDFMFWNKNHRFGWYLEPDYEVNFGRG